MYKDRFKSLERLEFRNMNKLYSFEGLEEGDMPSLRELKFEGCSALTVLPTLQPLASLTHLQITHCPMLLVTNIGLPTSIRQYHYGR